MALGLAFQTGWQLCMAGFLTLWPIYAFISRRYFHPLAKVPGPVLWAVSGLPILYQQHCKEGNLIHILTKLHAKYGAAPGARKV